MPAYVIVQLNVKNPEKMAENKKGASPTVEAHGGSFTLRGTVQETLAGDAQFNRCVKIEFPDADAARGWYNSAEYQALIPTRDEAADALFTLVETS